MSAKSFIEGGYFNSLPLHEQEALVEVARLTVQEMRKLDHADHAELDAYHAQRRKTNSQLELDALVKQTALSRSISLRTGSRAASSRRRARRFCTKRHGSASSRR